MRALVVILAALMLPPTVRGEDAPVPPAGAHHLVMAKGDLAPEDGVFAGAELAKYDAARVLYLEQQAAVKPAPSPPWLWVIVCFAVGVAGGYVARK